MRIILSIICAAVLLSTAGCIIAPDHGDHHGDHHWDHHDDYARP